MAFEKARRYQGDNLIYDKIDDWLRKKNYPPIIIRYLPIDRVLSIL